MMGPVGIGVLALALAGALASWVVGAIYYARGRAALDGREAGWLPVTALVAWPFMMKDLRDAATDQAAVVNKAMVAFIVCIVVAAATISLSTNYNRISK